MGSELGTGSLIFIFAGQTITMDGGESKETPSCLQSLPWASLKLTSHGHFWFRCNLRLKQKPGVQRADECHVSSVLDYRCLSTFLRIKALTREPIPPLPFATLVLVTPRSLDKNIIWEAKPVGHVFFPGDRAVKGRHNTDRHQHRQLSCWSCAESELLEGPGMD